MRQVHDGTVTLFPRREMLDLVVVDGKARGIVCRNLVTGEIERHVGARGGAGDRRLRHGVLPVHQRRELERHRGLARAQARGALRQPLLHADPSDVHPGQRRPSEQADADERVAPERRTRLGAEGEGRSPAARRRFPKPSATTTSNAGTRASATWCRATSRRGTPRACATRAAASATRGLVGLSRFRRRHHAARRGHDQGALRQPVRHVPAHHRRGSVQGADAHLPRHPLHDGRAVGGLQPDEQPAGTPRPRRGQLLGSRRQPSRRQRADAGAAPTATS